MKYVARCPNCGHKSPWDVRDVPIEVWCANCCAYDHAETHPQWIYNFTVLPRPQSKPKRRPDEDKNLYGGRHLR